MNLSNGFSKSCNKHLINVTKFYAIEIIIDTGIILSPLRQGWAHFYGSFCMRS